jgi:FkbM family methyltransferase
MLAGGDAAEEARLRTHPHFAALRDLVERGEMVPVPASARAVLLETADGWLLFPPRDAVQLPVVARWGSFQREELIRVLSLLQPLPGRTFVDVGANVGTHTLYAMRSGHFDRALAVEACPENARLLALNMRLNALTDSVTVVDCAVGAASGSATLIVNPHNCGDARLAPTEGGERLLGEEGFASIAVEIRTLDEVLESCSDPGLVWMDAQGAEGLILGPSRRLAGIPVHLEFWPYGMRALGSFAPLRAFAAEHARAVVLFEAGRAVEHPVSVLDRLYEEYREDARFVDLLILPKAGLDRGDSRSDS